MIRSKSGSGVDVALSARGPGLIEPRPPNGRWELTCGHFVIGVSSLEFMTTVSKPPIPLQGLNICSLLSLKLATPAKRWRWSFPCCAGAVFSGVCKNQATPQLVFREKAFLRLIPKTKPSPRVQLHRGSSLKRDSGRCIKSSVSSRSNSPSSPFSIPDAFSVFAFGLDVCPRAITHFYGIASS